MRNICELKYSTGLFNQKFCLSNQMVEIGDDIAEKNRELSIGNLNLRSEIERLKKVSFIDAATEK